MDASALDRAIRDLAHDIAEAHPGETPYALLGILRRGRPIADRLAACIESETGTRPPVGSLATTLYRDDVRSGKAKPIVPGGETHFDFDVDGTSIVLVDDVINSGRTIRAAMDEVIDYGRPARIQLACIIDRGLRELPIQADYLARQIDTQPGDHVSVQIREIDGEDVVLIRRSTT